MLVLSLAPAVLAQDRGDLPYLVAALDSDDEVIANEAEARRATQGLSSSS